MTLADGGGGVDNLPGLCVDASLRSRAARLRRDLKCAAESIDALPEPLRRRVAAGLHTDIATKQIDVTTDLIDPFTSGESEPGEDWAALHSLCLEVEEILQECLMLEQGAQRRSPPGQADAVDATGLVLRLADSLVDELAERTPITAWQSYAVLGVQEYFHSSSRAIQVRYPAPTLWELVPLAHELGHFVARQWNTVLGGRSVNRVDELHDRLDATREPEWYWVEELFADAYASHVLGPAYAFSCVVRDFDPLLTRSSNSHPCSHARVAVVLDTLRLSDPVATGTADQIGRLWCDLHVAAAADQAEDLPTGWTSEISSTVVAGMPASGFTGPAIERVLLAWEERSEISDDDLGAVPLSDVINAAWFARVGTNSPIELGEIGRRATALAARLLGAERRRTWR